MSVFLRLLILGMVRDYTVRQPTYPLINVSHGMKKLFWYLLRNRRKGDSFGN